MLIVGSHTRAEVFTGPKQTHNVILSTLDASRLHFDITNPFPAIITEINLYIYEYENWFQLKWNENNISPLLARIRNL